MAFNMGEFILLLLVMILVYGGLIALVVLAIRALLKYLRGDRKAKQGVADACGTQPIAGQPQGFGAVHGVDHAASATSAEVLQSLGDALKNARVARKFTQEYVADTLGVSRQAVSKWENGTSDPSTSNLIALAKLYDVSVETLLANVKG